VLSTKRPISVPRDAQPRTRCVVSESANLITSQPGILSWLCLTLNDLSRGSEPNMQATNVFKTAMKNLDTTKQYTRQHNMLPNMIPEIVPLVPYINATQTLTSIKGRNTSFEHPLFPLSPSSFPLPPIPEPLSGLQRLYRGNHSLFLLNELWCDKCQRYWPPAYKGSFGRHRKFSKGKRTLCLRCNRPDLPSGCIVCS
jgi:hypothetical protein